MTETAGKSNIENRQEFLPAITFTHPLLSLRLCCSVNRKIEKRPFSFENGLCRRKRDLNPRAAINDLLPFQGSPFSLLGISPKSVSQLFPIEKQPHRLFFKSCNAEGGIRTHAPLRTNGFQDRLVMTTSIPLHIHLFASELCVPQCK